VASPVVRDEPDTQIAN